MLNQGVVLAFKVSAKPVFVRLANNSIETSSKIVHWPLKIDENVYPIDAYVLENLSFDCLIGISFFRKNDVSILVDSNEIVIDSDGDTKNEKNT